MTLVSGRGEGEKKNMFFICRFGPRMNELVALGVVFANSGGLVASLIMLGAVFVASLAPLCMAPLAHIQY